MPGTARPESSRRPSTSKNPDEDAAGLDLVALKARTGPASSTPYPTGYGFGGVNASVIFKRWDG